MHYFVDIADAQHDAKFTFERVGETRLHALAMQFLGTRDPDAFIAAFDARHEMRADYVAIAREVAATDPRRNIVMLRASVGPSAIFQGAASALMCDAQGLHSITFDLPILIDEPMDMEFKVNWPTIIACSVVYIDEVHSLPIA